MPERQQDGERTPDRPDEGSFRGRDAVRRQGSDQDRRRYAEEMRDPRRLPLFRLFGYYSVLFGLAALILYLWPFLENAFVAPLGTGPITGIQSPIDMGVERAFQSEPQGWQERSATTAIVIFSTLSLVMPVAWVYTYTRPLRYDRSLVHSILLLPPAVAGIVMVVKNSLALAFSLAGIVAAVRFRTTLKDPKDAVHIFLVIGIGLAAGVQALDIAMILSLTFNLVVLIFWRYDLDVMYTDEKVDLLSVGDEALLVADTPAGRRRVLDRLERLAEAVKTDGILLVHTLEPAAARQAAEVVLNDVAKNWVFRDPPRGRNGVYTLEAAIQLRKKRSPVDLLGELQERWMPTVAAAEYVPYSGMEPEE